MEGIFGLFAPLFSCPIAVLVGAFVFVIVYFIARGTHRSVNPVKAGLIAGSLIGLIVLCILTGYYLDSLYSGPPSPTQQPAQEDLIGIWHITDGTRQMLEENGFVLSADVEYSLEFKDDGTVVAINVPHRQGDYFSSMGIWTVEKAGTKWYINVNYENGIYTSYNIYSENPPYSIYEMWGELTWLVFERR